MTQHGEALEVSTMRKREPQGAFLTEKEPRAAFLTMLTPFLAQTHLPHLTSTNSLSKRARSSFPEKG